MINNNSRHGESERNLEDESEAIETKMQHVRGEFDLLWKFSVYANCPRL